MASAIKSDNGVSSGVTGIVQTADSTGQLALQTTTSGGVATTAVTIDNSQKVTFANSIGFGSNAGITFNNSSALTNSTLNDYETGTWTPVISANGSGSPTFTASSAIGYYTKIGNTVWISAFYTYTDRGTVGGNYAWMNLPFTPNGTLGSFYVAINQNTADTNQYSGVCFISTYNIIGFRKNNNSGSPGYMIGSDFPSTGTVAFTCVYKASF